MLDNSWFVPIKTHPSNPLRIFCFHYAGGSMSVYRTWSEHIKNADLVTIQLPGRENRFTEALITEMDLIIDNLYENFSDFDNKPYVFFGHSLGALIAFEFAKKLQKQGPLGLKHLIVSGSRAPHLPIRRRLIYNLPDQELFSEIQKYNGIPENLLAEKDLLMNIMLPIIRADFTISDIYQCSTETKLKIPITVFGGRDDDTFPFEDLLQWKLHTDTFDYQSFAGNHFFIKSSFPEVIDNINSILTSI
jgi:medium-chain acyl-[acyl-carrier-protein] hydrolase